jgi:hypothetical protein
MLLARRVPTSGVFAVRGAGMLCVCVHRAAGYCCGFDVFFFLFSRCLWLASLHGFDAHWPYAVRRYDTLDKHTIPNLGNLASFTPRGFKPPAPTQTVDPARLFQIPQESRVHRPVRKAAASTAPTSAKTTPAVALQVAASTAARRATRVANLPKRANLVEKDPEEAKAFPVPWRLSASLILQRTAVVAKPLEEYQKQWYSEGSESDETMSAYECRLGRARGGLDVMDGVSSCVVATRVLNWVL